MSVMRRFFNFNRRVCRRLTPTHVHEANVFAVYRKLGALLLSHPDVHRVLDCGAGKSWHFPSHYKKWYDIHLIGADIQGDEIEHNPDLDEKIICDVTEAIPIDLGPVDLVMVYSGIEHFKDNQTFLRHAYACLRPGGFLLAQFPGRYAPFAIVNRVLPGRVAKRLIGISMQDHGGVLGFAAYYDRTHYSGFAAMADAADFDTVYYYPGFYSSSYAEFFFPLWILSYIYDGIRFALGTKNLASYNLFLLQKPDHGRGSGAFRLYAWE